MNLAIHDIRLLLILHESGQTRCWKELRVVAWITQGQCLGRPDLPALISALPLQVKEMTPEEAGFLVIFQKRLRRGLSQREIVLLFLAVRSGSVVLTGEPMVAAAAEGLGLRVCAGNREAMDRHFPMAAPAAEFENTKVCGELDPAKATIFPLKP